MTYDPQRSLELLRLGTGRPDAVFREDQEEGIRHVVEGRGRLLVVQKTGWGKSFVYFIAAKLLREAGAGPALLVSPLLALMRNQIMAAERMGVRAATINSENQEEWATVEGAIGRGEVDVLLISPERLANERFRVEVMAGVAARISLLVIDEAHCISDWGHDFRPHYRMVERIIRALPANIRVLATTATANNRVMADLEDVLGPNLHVSRGDLNRPSLLLQTIRLPRQSERLAWLAAQVPALPGHGDHLHAHGARCHAGGRLAAVTRPGGRGVLRRVWRTPRGARERAAREPGEGAGRHDGARHGLRQARPRLRDPLPDARTRSSRTTSRSDGRDEPSRLPTACC